MSEPHFLFRLFKFESSVNFATRHIECHAPKTTYEERPMAAYVIAHLEVADREAYAEYPSAYRE